MSKFKQAVKLIRTLLIVLPTLLLVAISGQASPFQMSAPNIWQVMPGSYRLVEHYSHDAVDAQIQTLSATPNSITKIAAQASPYLYYVYHEVRKRGLPGELALLPIIESAYNPFSISRAGAVGLWQIMPGTGSGFGLEIGWWYDGRRDTHASTQAALDYLTYLLNYFDGDWLLAIAAYHAGEGTVVRAKEKNISQNKATDFWSLPLPRETQAYVPRLLALAAITSRPDNFDVMLPHVANKPYFKQIDIGEPIELAKAAQLAHMDLDEFYQLNPGYNRWATSPDGPHTLVLPVNKVRVFKSNLRKNSLTKLMSWDTHTVQKGESINNIASHYDIDAHLLKEINHLEYSQERIPHDQTLQVPKKDYASAQSTPISERRHFVITKANNVGPQKITHYIQKGDSYETLEKQYNIPASAIRYWNQLPAKSPLQIGVGKKIVLWVDNQYTLYTGTSYYTVQSGDTLSQIAKRYNVSVADLKVWNASIANSKYLHPNQRLAIRNNKTIYYTVKVGDSLSSIANRFNVKVSDLKKWNSNIASEKYLYPDNRLTIQLSDRVHYYTVKPGDTLSHIAKKFNVKISDLKKWNTSLAGNKYLYPNQELLIYLV